MGVLHYRKHNTWLVHNTQLSLLSKATTVFFQVNMAMVFLVDVVLWGILYPMLKNNPAAIPLIFNFVSYNQHGTNAVFMLVELGLNRIPFFKEHVFVVILWPCIYGMFALIFHSITNLYVFTKFGIFLVFSSDLFSSSEEPPTDFYDSYAYPFLNTDDPWAVGWYLGMCLGHVAFFFLGFGLFKAKIKLFGIDENVYNAVSTQGGISNETEEAENEPFNPRGEGDAVKDVDVVFEDNPESTKLFSDEDKN